MRLISLELREWRAYEEEYIEFPDGLIGVAGRNGAGKTTLAEAIGWSLFGRLRKGQKQAELRRQGGSGRPTAELVFRLADSIYTVRRVAGGDCALWIGARDSEPEAMGSKNVSARISRELDLTWDVFRRTVFAEQKDVAALDPSSTGPARRAHVERLLGLTRYKVAADKARREVHSIDSEIRGRLAQVADPEELATELKAAEHAAEAESPKVAAAQSKLDKAQKKYKAAREAVKQEQKRATEAARLEGARGKAAELAEVAEGRAHDLRVAIQERDARTARLESIAKEADEAASASALAAKWRALADAEDGVSCSPPSSGRAGYDEHSAGGEEKRLEQLDSEREGLATKEGELRREVDQLEDRAAALSEIKAAGRVDQHKKRASELATEERRANERLTLHRSRLAEDEAHLEAVREGGPGTPCPVCKKPYGPEHGTILSDYTKRIENAKRDLPGLEQDEKELAGLLEEARDAHSRAREAEKALSRTAGPETLSGARATLRRAQQGLREVAERLATINDELPRLRSSVRALQVKGCILQVPRPRSQRPRASTGQGAQGTWCRGIRNAGTQGG